MSLPRSLDIKHIKTIGIIVALHSFIYGIGYLFGIGGFPDTILFDEVSQLVNPALFGFALVLTSLSLVVGYMIEKGRVISTASTFQSFVWLFATFVYVLDRDYLVAIAIAFVWSILSGYTAYAYKHRSVDVKMSVEDYLEL